MEFELGRIEGAFAGQLLPAIFGPGAAGELDRLAQVLLGLVPGLVAAVPLLRPERELDRVIGEAEILVDRIEQVAEDARLGDDLVLAAEDVGVVLGELAHPQYAVQRAVRLVAVAAAEFGEPERQVAIGFDPLAENQDVRRAVHRLQRHQIGVARQDRLAFLGAGDFVGDDEHVLAILAPMARRLPLARVHDLRRLHLLDSRPRRAGGAYRLRAARQRR